jgi:hypothetical protein
VSVDIIEMSPSFRSQIVHLSLLGLISLTLQYSASLPSLTENKKPCFHRGKQGLEKSLMDLRLPAYLRVIQIRHLPFKRSGQAKAKDTTLA